MKDPFQTGQKSTRRGFLLLAASCLAGPRLVLAASATARTRSGVVSIEDFSAAGASLGVADLPRIVKTEANWRAQLSESAFHVTREEGTEWAFTGAYASYHGDGLYRCICCATALFDSRTKFESGTGWPSFWRPISRHNVIETEDTSLLVERIAVSCARCNGHLGHVFDDGPKPTGLRYCMNSVALNFAPRAKA